MITMHRPPHPGAVLKDTVFGEGSALSVNEFADRLGVHRVVLSRLLNGRAGVSAEMALRLSAALGTSPESWLHLQADYDIAAVSAEVKRKIGRIKRLDP
jgi:addiction module HigA family antidote